MKKGLISSTGCKLKKYKSNQRFEPFISSPTKGTINNAEKRIKKSGIIDFFKIFKSRKEIKNMTNKDKITNKKCFEKKEVVIFIKSFSC